MFVQGQQPVHVLSVKVLDDVNLVEDGPHPFQVAGGGMAAILVDTIDTNLSAVSEKLASEHFEVRFVTVKRVAGRVHADEGLAGLDPLDKRVFVRDGQGSGSIGK